MTKPQDSRGSSCGLRWALASRALLAQLLSKNLCGRLAASRTSVRCNGEPAYTDLFEIHWERFKKHHESQALQTCVCVRSRAWSVLCEHLATPVRTPRLRSRSEVLVRSIRSHHPTAGSSSAGLSARHKHAGRAATGRRRELGLAREQNEERAAALAMRVSGWGGARVGMAIRRPRLL